MPHKFSKGRIRLLSGLVLLALNSAFAISGLAQICSTPSFTQPPIYPVGNDVRSLVGADFDGDGRPDLAVANADSNSVTVVTNVARGTAAHSTTYGVGAFPLSIAAGDFNGDSRPDIVTANNSGGNVTLLINDGGGGFSSGVSFGAVGGARSIVAGDFNADGRLDLAVGTGINVSVFLGNGQGGFGAPTNVTGGASFIVAADFNQDARLDLAVANSSIQILNGNGTGQFVAGCGAGPVGDGMAVGDLNADGKPDLVSANVLSAQIHAMLGDGNGCFAGPVSINVLNFGRPRHVALGDLNNDGKADIIAGTTLILGNGSGGFATPVYYGSGSVGPDPGSNTIVGDFDGDGRLDLSTAGRGSVGILLGDGSGGIKYSAGPSDRGANGIASGDLNGDGKFDLVVGSNGGATRMLGDGAGGFGPPQSVPSSTVSHGVVIADFNRDAKLDIASLDPTANGPGGSPRFHVNLGDGLGGFGSIISSSFDANQPRSLATGDFNGDGKPDLLTVNGGGGNNNEGSISIAFGDGVGRFISSVIHSVRTPSNPKSIGIGDLNTDGKVDLAIPSGFGFSILLGNGTGGFGPRSHITNANASSLVIADLNNDGRADLAMVSEEPNGKLSVVLGDGAGSFGPPSQFSIGTFSRDVVLADLNGDGKIDAAATNGKQSVGPLGLLSTVSVLLGDGTGGFGPASEFAADKEPGALVAGDFNNDGKPDLMTANQPVNNISAFMNTCPGSFPGALQLSTTAYSLNEDGHSVTITVNRTGDNAGTATVNYATSDSAGSAACSTATGNASSQCDYASRSGTLSFAPGETSKSFNVPFVDDGWLEGNENFMLTLSSPTGATLGSPASATVFIVDNDSAGAVPSVFMDSGTSRAIALNSVTFVRGPFSVMDPSNFSADGQTRLILFTSNLRLTQADPAYLSVQASGVDLPIEKVGTVFGVVGLDASYIVVKLPLGLPTGDLQLIVTLRGTPSTAGVLEIVP